MFRTVNTSRLVASFPITLSDRHSLLKRQSRSYYVRNRWRVLMDMKRLPCRALNELGCHEKRSITDWSNSSFGESLVADRVVGILGGGQLGRMAALAAANLGVKVKCLDPTPNAPASVAAEQVIGDFKDPEAILNFAKGCDVLTVEIEHVDVEALRKVSKKYGIPVQPSPDALEIIQDKYLQKMHFRRHGLPVGSAVEVNAYKSLQAVCEQGFPVMLKSRRLAYDGRGNFVINSMQDIQSGVDALGGYGSQLYVEQWVQFKKELAVMVARSVDDTVLSYPVVETIHKNSICFVTEAPADVDNSILTKAQKVAEEAVKCLKGAGIFGVEMFLLDDGEVLINEVAPRPHNSGHYTIDACSTSQFEQHIRAILGWPLGDPSLIVKNAIMLNILGEESGKHGLIQAQNMIQRALSIPGAKAHWYEKTDVKKNRKVGHINIIGSSREESRNRLKLLSHEANTMLTSTSSSETDSNSNAQVSVIMGSDSDLVTMKAAADVLEEFGIPTEVTIVSAHRTPERMMNFAKTAHERGIKVIIAGAGGAAHLPGMVAAMTPLPVIGVPCVPSGSHLDGIDSLLSIVQMPKGVPVATVAIGNAANAGLLAVRILSAGDKLLQESMIKYQKRMANMVMDKVDRLERNGLK